MFSTGHKRLPSCRELGPEFVVKGEGSLSSLKNSKVAANPCLWFLASTLSNIYNAFPVDMTCWPFWVLQY